MNSGEIRTEERRLTEKEIAGWLDKKRATYMENGLHHEAFALLNAAREIRDGAYGEGE